MEMRSPVFWLIFCSILGLLFAVDTNNFKTCEQSSFCRRSRKIQAGSSKFALVPGTLNSYSDSITAVLINKETHHLFVLKLEALQSNTFRVLIDEKTPLKARYRVEHALKEPPKPATINIENESEAQLTIKCGTNKAIIVADPFRIDFYENGILTVAVNAKGLMHFEHLRSKPQTQITVDEQEDEAGAAEAAEAEAAEVAEAGAEAGKGYVAKVGKVDVEEAENVINNNIERTPEDDDPGAWDENFKSHHDSKPNGPEAVALDFSFPAAEVLFGIPEHADNFILRSTSGTDPYRLYNLDVFEYVLESKMALYGSVPVLYGHGTQRTAGVYWQNAAETWVDIYTAEKNMVSSIVNFVSGSRNNDPPAAHFMSESGIIDAFIMLGPKPIDAFQQYSTLTGTTNLPQLFSLAYHQCRWNYNDERDVETVAAKFDEYDIPMDTMWLDIEYTDAKKYFTWDEFKFTNPLGMIQNLTKFGRHLVIIIDPHIKRDGNYFFHNECTARSYYTKTHDGRDYEGWCWPGAASYPDFFNPEVRNYYAEQYLLSNFKTTTADVMIWNDMNEPSVFNGPEVTMYKDLIHFGNWEHRDVHNLYGHMFIMATFDGLLKRDADQRPFILSRAHFAGSQRYAAIWTGDNNADWGHLQHSLKMCLSEAVAGFSFCGSDVGGFFGEPDAELFERWYQSGAFMPFFRSHAHIDTKRREPWLFPEKTRLIIREAIRKRYSYLPFWYTMFYEHELKGVPVMLPLLAHYPGDKDAFTIETQYLLQNRLLVRPVLQAGVSKVDVYFPAIDDKKSSDYWYDVDNFQRYEKAGYTSIGVNENKIPVYQRGGTIVPKKERVRRAATLMKNDPYTLIVCLDREGKARGTLYLDDEKSYDYRRGKYIYVEYEFAKNELRNHFLGKPNYKTESWLERIVIAGHGNRVPKTATLKIDGDNAVELEILKYDEETSAFVIRKPGINMAVPFAITLNY